MNRKDHLGTQILSVLETSGRHNVMALAEILHECPRAIAVACIALHRLGRARPIATGKTVVIPRYQRRKPEIVWEIGRADVLPPMPHRGHDQKGKRHTVIEETIGSDDEEHREWMERYRRQRRQRLQWMHDDARLRL